VAAAQADPQMHPAVSGLQAFFAAVGIALAGGDVVEVCAILAHKNSWYQASFDFPALEYPNFLMFIQVLPLYTLLVVHKYMNLLEKESK
jgi:hypothetical protein